MPKVKRPKKGWFVAKKRRPKTTPSAGSKVRGLPPCPACGKWTMQKDNTKNELFCRSCGAIL